VYGLYKFLSRIVANMEETLIVFLMVAMTLITFTQVVLRYVFNSGLDWGVEGTTNLFAWLVLVGMSYGIRVASHIGVDVWVRKLPPKGKRVAALLGAVACIAYAALLLIGSLRYEMVMYKLGVEAEDLPIQRWILLASLPLGFGLLLVRLIELTWLVASGRQNGLLGDEAEEQIRRMKAMDNLMGTVRK